MLIDDRLATVLRARADSEAGARTQFRQLLDLLGSGPLSEDLELVLKGYERLTELAERIPGEEQSRIMRQPGLRLRNRHLVSFLARGDAKPAAAAMATAQLPTADWLMIIPRMPITARGFLRHRRDLPAEVKTLLDRLGVQDMVLPRPGQDAVTLELIEPAPAVEPAPEQPQTAPSGSIASVLKRIAEFQESRRTREANGETPSPRDLAGELAADPLARFDLTSDIAGTIVSASATVAPWLVGLDLGDRPAGGTVRLARLDPATRSAIAGRRPFHDGLLELDAAQAVSGAWRIDGTPRFESGSGRFLGYFLRLQRPLVDEEESEAAARDSAADVMRQTLHELRTPVNAIQGFAEIIQQQLFGPVPNTYRALAAGIAVDAAKLLAGFDEIDRLTKLESGAMELEAGEADLRAVLTDTIRRLDGVLRERQAGFALTVRSPFTVAIAEAEAALIAWRLLGGLAGSLSPGEHAEVLLTSDSRIARLEIEMPLSIVDVAGKDEDRPLVSAGMFSRSFTLRLAEAEVRAAGGTFTISREWLRVRLPLLGAGQSGTDDMLASRVRAS